MHVRRSLIALVVMSVAGVVLVHPATADDDVRRRAEALARDATAEFDKALPTTAATSPSGSSGPLSAGQDGAGPLGPVVDWFGRAADVYSREIFPRIVAGRPDEGSNATTLAAAEDWLRRAGRTYQTVVVPGLAETQPVTEPKAAPVTVAETVSPTPRIDEAARQNELKRLAEVKADEARKAATRRAEDEARRVADAGTDAEKKKAEDARAAARKAAEEKLEEARREQEARMAAEQKARAEAATKRSELEKKAAEEKTRLAADEKARFDAAKAAVEKKISDDAAAAVAGDDARGLRRAAPHTADCSGATHRTCTRGGGSVPGSSRLVAAGTPSRSIGHARRECGQAAASGPRDTGGARGRGEAGPVPRPAPTGPAPRGGTDLSAGAQNSRQGDPAQLISGLDVEQAAYGVLKLPHGRGERFGFARDPLFFLTRQFFFALLEQGFLDLRLEIDDAQLGGGLGLRLLFGRLRPSSDVLCVVLLGR